MNVPTNIPEKTMFHNEHESLHRSKHTNIDCFSWNSSLQTEKERELVKKIEGDARLILSKLHHYHIQ